MKRSRLQKRGPLAIRLMVIPLMLIGILISQSVNAQTINNGQAQKSQTTVQTQKGTVTTEPVPNAGQEVIRENQLPYYQYKGIMDLEMAKEAWIKDKPEEYKALLEKGSQKTEPRKD